MVKIMARARRGTLYAFLIVGLLLRLALVGVFSHTQFVMDDDSGDYLTLTEHLRAGDGFIGSFRTPLYPLFLLIHRVLLGAYWPALVTQTLMVVFIAWWIARFAAARNRPRAGLIAAALFLFMPFSILVSVRYLTQTLFAFFLVLAIWLWTEHRHAFLVGLVLGLSALVRPIAFLVWAPFGVALLWRRQFVPMILLIAGFYLVVMPWMLRNERLFGHASLSSITSYQLYFYDAPHVYAANHGLSYAQAREILEHDAYRITGATTLNALSTFQYSDILQSRALAVLTESPVILARVRLKEIFTFFTRDGIHDWFNKFGLKRNIFVMIGERLVLALLLVGAIRSAVRFPLIALVIAYFALLSGAVSSAGLRFPVEPFIILLGIMGLGAIWNIAKQKF